MEVYRSLFEPRTLRHDLEAHQKKQEEYVKDPSCPKCYPITIIHDDFKNDFEYFLEWYKKNFYKIGRAHV